MSILLHNFKIKSIYLFCP